MANSEKFIRFCDRAMAFSFYAMIFFMPIAIFFVETFTVTALVFYFLKRGAVFFTSTVTEATWRSQNLIRKLFALLKAFKPVDNILNWPIAVFLIVNALTILISPYPAVSLKGFLGKVLQNTFIYFNFIEAINSKKRFKIFFSVYLVSFSIVCLNGIFQYFVGQDFIHGQPMYDGRVYSSMRQSNDFGAYLIVLLPVLFCLAFLPSKVKGQQPSGASSIYARILFFSVFLLGLSNLGLTFSRGACLAFIVAMVLMSLNNKWFMCASFIVLLVFLNFYVPAMFEARGQFDDFLNFFKYNNRTVYWKTAWSVIKDHFWIGEGVNAYSLYVRDAKLYWGGYPHNCYFQMMAETGLIGLVSFLWILSKAFHFIITMLKRTWADQNQPMLLGFFFGLLAYLVHSFFDTIYYSVQLGSLFWLLLGIVMSQTIIKGPMPKDKILSFTLLLVVALASGWYEHARPVKQYTDVFLKKAYECKERSSLACREANLKKAAFHNPQSSEVFFQRATFELDRGSIREAISLFEKAIELQESHPLASLELGKLYFGMKKTDLAKKYLFLACRYNSGNSEAQFYTGEVLEQEKEYIYALQHYTRVKQDSPYYYLARAKEGAMHFLRGNKRPAWQQVRFLQRSGFLELAHELVDFFKAGVKPSFLL